MKRTRSSHRTLGRERRKTGPGFRACWSDTVDSPAGKEKSHGDEGAEVSVPGFNQVSLVVEHTKVLGEGGEYQNAQAQGAYGRNLSHHTMTSRVYRGGGGNHDYDITILITVPLTTLARPFCAEKSLSK